MVNGNGKILKYDGKIKMVYYQQMVQIQFVQHLLLFIIVFAAVYGMFMSVKNIHICLYTADIKI